MNGRFREDFGLRTQIQRASVSVTPNIAERFERAGNKEFSQFLSQSKGSCGEVRSDLYVAMDQGSVDTGRFAQLYGQAVEVGRLVSGFMKYFARISLKGGKFK